MIPPMTEEEYSKKRKEGLKTWFSGISIYQFRTEVLSPCNYSIILTHVKANFFCLPSSTTSPLEVQLPQAPYYH